jgi:large subunit ribosomal protein L4
MKVPVKNLENKAVGEVELPEAVFGYPYKEHLVHLAVVSIRNAQRAGTHKTKGRHEVSGSGKKLWKQKGTGRARVGSRRTPLWRKGGTVHGPQPRSYANNLSAGEKRNALKSALSHKLAESRLVVLDNFELESHKTQGLQRALLGLGVEGKTLLVDGWGNERLRLASRNNPRLKSVDALGVNVYDVVDRGYLVLSREALERLIQVLSK